MYVCLFKKCKRRNQAGVRKTQPCGCGVYSGYIFGRLLSKECWHDDDFTGYAPVSRRRLGGII